ncbi:hypothetical protein F4779DRAFT_574928 [Xylariaceae sp. FL0662B]|nr:hypothetical protein F4779DRAFT_574928 [Xylariaceae sp. FL0662B]
MNLNVALGSPPRVIGRGGPAVLLIARYLISRRAYMRKVLTTTQAGAIIRGQRAAPGPLVVVCRYFTRTQSTNYGLFRITVACFAFVSQVACVHVNSLARSLSYSTPTGGQPVP